MTDRQRIEVILKAAFEIISSGEWDPDSSTYDAMCNIRSALCHRVPVLTTLPDRQIPATLDRLLNQPAAGKQP